LFFSTQYNDYLHYRSDLFRVRVDGTMMKISCVNRDNVKRQTWRTAGLPKRITRCVRRGLRRSRSDLQKILGHGALVFVIACSGCHQSPPSADTQDKARHQGEAVVDGHPEWGALPLDSRLSALESDISFLKQQIAAAEQKNDVLAEKRHKLLAEKEQLERDVAELEDRATIGHVIWSDGSSTRLFDLQFDYAFIAYGDPLGRLINAGPRHVKSRRLSLKTVVGDVSYPKSLPLESLAKIGVDDGRLKVVAKSGDVFSPAVLDFESIASTEIVFVRQGTLRVCLSMEKRDTYYWLPGETGKNPSLEPFVTAIDFDVPAPADNGR